MPLYVRRTWKFKGNSSDAMYTLAIVEADSYEWI